MQDKHFEVVVIGGGITGAALVYELARYTDIKKIALVEKYDLLASLNTQGTANSQTLHSGDIETNYTFEKAKKVRRTALMITKYADMHGYGNKFIFKDQKMALGVGKKEAEFIKNRFEEFKSLYPDLKLFSKNDLKEIEPKVVFDENNNERKEELAAIGQKSGLGAYTTADFKKLTESFIENAKKQENKECEVFLNSEVVGIDKKNGAFHIKTRNNLSISADFVVVDCGAHSLFLAHKMGYGKDLGSISIAGDFYFTKKRLLNGKVYMVQNPKLPFAALHGDPDILKDRCTRFGPTAFAMPKLERFHGNKSVMEFFKTINFGSDTLKVVYDLVKDKDIRNYLIRNIGFETPFIKKNLFVKAARKIVPSLMADDLYYAKGFGGIRGQIIDKKNKKLLLGEARIDTKEGIIFNMTPSPGATSCLGNAENDVKIICEYLNKKFDSAKFNKELVGDE